MIKNHSFGNVLSEEIVVGDDTIIIGR